MLRTLDVTNPTSALRSCLPLPASLTAFSYVLAPIFDPHSINQPDTDPDFSRTITLPPNLTSLKIEGMKGGQWTIASPAPQAKIHPLPSSLSYIDLDQPFQHTVVQIMKDYGLPETITSIFFHFDIGSEEMLSKLPRGLQTLLLDSYGAQRRWHPAALQLLPPTLTHWKPRLDVHPEDMPLAPKTLRVIEGILNSTALARTASAIPPQLEHILMSNTATEIIPMLPKTLTLLDCRLSARDIELFPPHLTYVDLYIENADNAKIPPLPATVTVVIATLDAYTDPSWLPLGLRSLKLRLLECNRELTSEWSSLLPRGLSSLSLAGQHMTLSRSWYTNLPANLETLILWSLLDPPQAVAAYYPYCGLLPRSITSLSCELPDLEDLSELEALPSKLEYLRLQLRRKDCTRSPGLILDALPHHVGTLLISHPFEEQFQVAASDRRLMVEKSPDMSLWL